MTPGFLVRLDELMDGGMSEKHRALAVEQWERPPEEWERFRPVPRTPQSYENLRLATPWGVVEILASHFVPPGIIVVRNGVVQTSDWPRRGVGLGTIQESIEAAARVGRRELRVILAPPNWAALNSSAATSLLLRPPTYPAVVATWTAEQGNLLAEP